MRVRFFVMTLGLIGVDAAGQPAKYRIYDLTEISQPLGVVQCEGRRVNEAGRIVGWELTDMYARAIVWDADLTPRLLPALPGDNSTIAYGVTPDGDPLGESNLITIQKIGHQIHITQDAKAVVWRNGEPIRVADAVTGGPVMDLRAAWDINGAGTLIGHADVPGGPFGTEPRGFALTAGVITDLGDLHRPTAINASGDMVGVRLPGVGSEAHLWSGGVLTNLNANPLFRPVSTEAWDINGTGWIAGAGQVHPGGAGEPILWVGGTPQRLITHLTRPQGAATGVNNVGQVCGYWIDLDNSQDVWHGALWEDGARRELLDLIGPTQGWEQLLPWHMNDRGVIVGGGVRNNELGHGFVMIPTCYADCNEDGQLTVADFGCFQTEFVQGDPYADCNEDGQLSVADFGCFQTRFVQACP